MTCYLAINKAPCFFVQVYLFLEVLSNGGNAIVPDFPVYHPVATRSKLEPLACLPREKVVRQFSDLVGDVHRMRFTHEF